ncbi:MAG: iron-containing redox enzyme family protein, partial [Candidatus Spechtbacteria bacterium]|nr:iron-containing redox enzyme family protein [Candidatus Spechtbacteria bacterium]
HLRCPIREIRQDILQNLWDEEHGPDNHRKLWLDFCEKLGLNRVEIERTADNAHTHKYSSDYPVLQGTHDLLVTYTRLANVINYQDGLAALYAYESQIPVIARAKIRSMHEHYNIHDLKALQFFVTHYTQDVEHATNEAQGIVMYISQADCHRIEESAREALDAWWGFLDGLNTLRMDCKVEVYVDPDPDHDD